MDGWEEEERLTGLLRRCGKYMYYHHSKPGMQQGMVLHLLSGGPMTQRQLQQRLGTQPASVSELITKMEKKRLLERRRSEADRRQVQLTLTEKGRQFAQSYTQRPTAGMFDALTSQERDELAALLEKLLADWFPDRPQERKGE